MFTFQQTLWSCAAVSRIIDFVHSTDAQSLHNSCTTLPMSPGTFSKFVQFHCQRQQLHDSSTDVRAARRGVMTEESPRLYVGNLPYVAQKHDIERLFEDNNINM